METRNNKTIDQFSNMIMKNVTLAIMKILPSPTDDQLDMIVKILREEIKDFLFETVGKYKNGRECLQLNSINSQYIYMSLVTECVDRIRKEVI